MPVTTQSCLSLKVYATEISRRFYPVIARSSSCLAKARRSFYNPSKIPPPPSSRLSPEAIIYVTDWGINDLQRWTLPDS